MVGSEADLRLCGGGDGRVDALTYDNPLTQDDRLDLFRQWRELNPQLWYAMERHAMWLYEKGHRRISTKYLIEWARYELSIKAKGVPFTDRYGKEHVYGINNNDTALMGRLLLELHPELPIETRGA